ncbi:TPA: acyl carrier protein [Pseudomonas aeruginosa]|nr:acyl carrier protein [Pseudomonas aeruginosa]
MQSATEAKIRKIVADVSAADLRQVTLDSSLESLDCEDLLEELAESIQDEFDLDKIDDDVVEGWKTVGDICRYVLKNPQ